MSETRWCACCDGPLRECACHEEKDTIGTVRVNMDDGTVYRGGVRTLSSYPSLSGPEYDHRLEITIKDCEVIRPQHARTEAENLAIALVNAIRAELNET